ncbi:MAG: hypothetical protein KC417_04650 [Myxococcales bacterium]|nr:hypothetical protein [Myxococcales bacterium]
MARRVLWLAPLLAVGLVCAATNVAFAQSLDKARSLYLDADFETALAEFEAVLERPGLTPDEAAESHRYLATLRALLGDKAAAEKHARAALAIDPSAAPARGAPKALEKLFESLRQELGGKAATLTIQAEGDVNASEPLVLSAVLDPAPVALATLLSLRCVSGSGAPEEAEGSPPRVEVELASVEGEVNCRASAMTSSRAPIFTARERFGPGDGQSGTLNLASPGDEEEDEGGSVWPWIAVGGVAVAGAVVAGILLLSSSSSDSVSFDKPVVKGW